jgi:hypothetical protein
MIVNTYEEWLESKILELRQAIEKEGEAPKFKCTACFGSGHITDYGEKTGEAFDACCPDCEGAGEVELQPSHLNIESIEKLLKPWDYEKELIADLRRVARFTGRNECAFLSEHDICVFCEVSSKKTKAVGKWGIWTLEVLH